MYGLRYVVLEPLGCTPIHPSEIFAILPSGQHERYIPTSQVLTRLEDRAPIRTAVRRFHFPKVRSRRWDRIKGDLRYRSVHRRPYLAVFERR